MVHIGIIFRKTRLDLNLKQVTIARRAGLKREYVNRIEAGKIQPTLPTLKKIAVGTGVPLAEMVEAWERAND